MDLYIVEIVRNADGMKENEGIAFALCVTYSTYS